MTDAQRINELIAELGIKATTASQCGDGIEIDWNGDVEQFASYEAARAEVLAVGN